ncbi:MAG: hypothetical protein ACK5OC_19665, partial [Pirellula sp.]
CLVFVAEKTSIWLSCHGLTSNPHRISKAFSHRNTERETIYPNWSEAERGMIVRWAKSVCRCFHSLSGLCGFYTFRIIRETV